MAFSLYRRPNDLLLAMNTLSPLRSRLPQFTDRLLLGNRGLRVSPFCLGIVQSPETVGAAFDSGINFFFVTADMHWPLYAATRQGLQALLARGGGVRDQVVVAGVCYPTQPEFCSMPFNELLEAVPGLERLDVLLAGGANAREFADRLPVYLDHRGRGYLCARAIGATFHDRAAALHAVQEESLDIALIRYNPDHSGARQDVFPHLPRQRRTLLFNFKSTFRFVPPQSLEEMGLHATEYWHPEITDYYRFALSRPELDGVLMAPRTPVEVQALAAALAKGPLTEEEEAYLMDTALVARGEACVGLETQLGME
jgi:hypothetical protein